jgi:Methyltransferase FkbM domain
VDAPDGVAGHTVAILVDMLPDRYCDLLKFDIEGAEVDVFSEGNLDWIDRVAVILVEPDGGLARNFVTRVAEARGFRVAPAGDKIILWREAVA